MTENWHKDWDSKNLIVCSSRNSLVVLILLTLVATHLLVFSQKYFPQSKVKLSLSLSLNLYLLLSLYFLPFPAIQIFCSNSCTKSMTNYFLFKESHGSYYPEVAANPNVAAELSSGLQLMKNRVRATSIYCFVFLYFSFFYFFFSSRAQAFIR